jgi:hypothetical protein
MLLNLLSNLICFFKKITTPRDYSVVNEELEYSVDYDMRYRIEDDFWKGESKDWDGILENFHADVTGLDVLNGLGMKKAVSTLDGFTTDLQIP